ncbi:MAG TPA: GAF domain-containing protein [Anaerolineales bacterium]|nr:GAF domain-containing protein [Anaerolineales bacterium]
MPNFLSSLITSSDITEEQKQATQRMLRNILFIVIATSSLISFVDGILFGRLATLYALAPLAILSILSLYYLRRKVFWPARIVIPLGTLISVSYIIWVGNGLHDIGISSFGIVIIMAGLTLGANGLIVFGALSALAIIIIGIAEINGYIAYPFGTVGISDIAIISIAILAGAFLLRLLLNRLQQTISQVIQSEDEQKRTNAELLELKASLEQQVQERTAELAARSSDLESAASQIQRRAGQFEALAQVAQTITLIRDLQELLPEIANVVSEKYGFYHVGVFLTDNDNKYAVLAATNSEGGKRMLKRNHRLKVGEQGIVGSVTGSGISRIALDVGADAVFFNNPDLPETHSEMALPLRSGDKVIGALDVQSTESGAFTDEDVQTLSLLADQVSLAIENARLFEDSSKTLSDLQTLMRQSTREAWARLPEQQNLLGYRYNATGASPLKERVEVAEYGKGEKKDGQTGAGTFVVPIELRGEVIGNLVVQSPAGSEWNEDQQDLIKAVAERVALSAENARLFDETSKRAERERLVSEITSKIRSHNDPQTMIETAVNELKNALGTRHVEIIPQKTKDTSNKETKV